MKASPKRIYVVYARWCPHCVPTTVEPIERKAREAGIPVELLDIDTDAEGKADELVEKYGDWTPDYLIPQVFVEREKGKIEHAFTGDPRGVRYTRDLVDNFVKGLQS